MNKYKASLFNYLFNSINAIVVIINGIIMVPIYFKFISVSTYGAWLATGNVVGMLGLVESGFASVITQKMSIAIADKDRETFFQLASANIYTAIFMFFGLLIIGLPIYPFIADWINVDESIKHPITIAYIISLVSAAISLFVSLIGAFPQVWQETKSVGIIATCVNILGICSLIVFLNLGYGVVSLALGYITRGILNFLGQGLWILKGWQRKGLSFPEFNKDMILELIRDCFYPFLSKISGVLMVNSQSFIIALFLNPTIAAIYDITSKISVVACNFLNMANGSFFAFFSLTFASKNLIEINKVVKNISIIFITILVTVLVYSAVFSRPVVGFWVGLDKFGGNLLLILIVFSLLVTQLKQYFNSLLYSGGLINVSAKLDVISMILYVVLVLFFIGYLKVYALPIASIFSGGIFLRWYIKLLNNKLDVTVKPMLSLLLRLIIFTIPFVLIHYLLNFNLLDIKYFAYYSVFFSIFYFTLLFILNRQFFIELLHKLNYGLQK